MLNKDNDIYLNLKEYTDCGEKNICGNDDGEYIKDSEEELFCRKPICEIDRDCGSNGWCWGGRCHLKCDRDSECKPYVSTSYVNEDDII